MNKNQTKKPNSTPAILIQGLTKRYGNVTALRGIDLSVEKGEIFGFLGPNGAGKTTTIRCMLDMLRPNGGKVTLLGIDPRKDPVAIQKLTGYLPGEMQFYDNLTAEKQLRFFNDMRDRRADWKYITKLVKRLDVNLKQPIKNMSKGNKQKIGVIQALMHKPDLLILDEPTSGLDPLIQHEVLVLLREANASGATVFFSSHVMSEVESVTKRVAIIRSGQIVEVAETSELTRRTLNRLIVRFKHPVVTDAIKKTKGVKVMPGEDETKITLEVTGDMEKLVKVLGQYPVLDLETERPSLEEAFRAYYH